MTETEIKLRWPEERGDPRTFLEDHGFRESQSRALESDQLFDRPSAELRKSDQILRLRQASGNAVVTYKGPADREKYKSREEIEFEVSDPARFRLVLDRLGFAPGFRYEKFRTTFMRRGEDGIATIDETPMGTFLELEGEKSWIDANAIRLGFTANDYITASYAALYREFRRTCPDASADMVFPV